MKILIIETTPATPHAETALELGIKEALAGSEVIYSPIFHLVPQLFWKSNINGNNKGKEDSLTDWIEYLVNIINKFSLIDIPSTFDINNLYSLEEIKKDPLNFSYDGHPLGTLVSSTVIEIYKETNLELIDNNKLFFDLALTAAITYEISKNLIIKHTPDKVVFFNGRTIETHPIYLAAKNLKVEMIIHERGPTKNHFTIWEDLPHNIEYYCNEIKRFSQGRKFVNKKLSAAIFYERQRSANLSNFNYIATNQNHDLKINLPNLDEKYIVFFTSSNWELELILGQDLSNGLGNQYQVVERLSNICKDECIQLVIRLHPNSPESEVIKFNLISQKNQDLVISPKDSLSSYSLGQNAYRNFTYGSTISWEFMYSNVCCAILSKSIGSGFQGVVEISNYNSLVNYIRNDLIPIDSTFSIIFGDFIYNYGERYDYYKPSTLFSGFLNLDLERAI